VFWSAMSLLCMSTVDIKEKKSFETNIEASNVVCIISCGTMDENAR
jgi:hypothetical protein